MDAERWQEISRLYLAALACDVETRDAFLRDACPGDEALRREVESLLNQPTSEPLASSAAVTVAGREGSDATGPARSDHLGLRKGSRASGTQFGPLGEEELPDRTLTIRYRFAHVLYHDALYLSLTPARKAALSVAVAQPFLPR